MLKIGSIEDNDGEYIIHREFYRQGMIFKDEEAYKFHKDQSCYSPDCRTQVYTGNDFLELCNCQQVWRMSCSRALTGNIPSRSRKIGS